MAIHPFFVVGPIVGLFVWWQARRKKAAGERAPGNTSDATDSGDGGLLGWISGGSPDSGSDGSSSSSSDGGGGDGGGGDGGGGD
ncbi:hypothetical protein [uncultured Alsobacter sp.]|uniref:hypothetical protein n=1 Tax=uncultured Alsobacter sp. TaxID=1748258 RepID=UPI0025FB3639|nr:hypothetical protein [uncultured Alsobacter sp.]